jgi:hypothetical protein
LQPFLYTLPPAPAFHCRPRSLLRAHLRSGPSAQPSAAESDQRPYPALGGRADAENWQPDGRAEAIKRFREDGETGVAAFVAFCDRRGMFDNFLTCVSDVASLRDEAIRPLKQCPLSE